ncbi:MAG: TIGR03435 family protein [Terriglobia bacterium]
MLESTVYRPVVDRTGLTGKFHFQLSGSPGAGPCSALTSIGSADAGASSSDGPSLFTALREQLGLKMVSQRRRSM